MTISYTPPPSPAYLSTAAPISPTISFLALFDQGLGMSRNYCNNALGRPVAGVLTTRNQSPYTSGADSRNTGDSPLWMSGGFPFDSSGAADVVRATNGTRCIAWPNSSINANTVTSGSNARTYFIVFRPDAIDCTSSTCVPIFGQTAGSFAGAGASFFDGVAIYNKNGSAYLGWGSQSGCMYNTDSTGNTPGCPLVAGHWYVAAVAVNEATSAMRFYLFDLTANATIQPSGTQYFNGGFGVQTGQRYSNWASGTVAGGSLGDTILFPASQFVGAVRLAGVDNSFWDDTNTVTTVPSAYGTAGYSSQFAWLVANIYGMLSATRPTTGSPPAALYNASGVTNYAATSSAHPYGYSLLPLFSYSSSGNAAGCAPVVKVYAPGDIAITATTDAAITVTVSPPLASPNAITSYNYYASTTYPFTPGAGNLVYSGPATSYAYAAPSKGVPYYIAVIATDSASNNFTYATVIVTLRDRPVLRTIFAGNSILRGVEYSGGGYLEAFCAAAGAFNTSVVTSTQGSDGLLIDDFLPTGSAGSGGGVGASSTSPFGFGGTTTYMDWLLFRLQQEYLATGSKMDAVYLQVTGNSPNATAAQFSAVSSRILGNGATTTGLSGATYQVGARRVVFIASPAQMIGHDLTNVALQFTTNATAASVSDNVSVFTLGLGAQKNSVTMQWDDYGGHPSYLIQEVMGYSLFMDSYNAFINPAASVAAAAYAFAS